MSETDPQQPLWETAKFGPADYKDMPWKNGGGTTRELLRLPHPSGDASRFLARVSVATVAAAGPFSAFPGVDRVLMLVDGAGVSLSFAPNTAEEVPLCRALVPLRFPGECGVECRLLGGPVRDFNLMTDRASLRDASLAVVALPPGAPARVVDVADACTLVAVCLAGSATVCGVSLAQDETLCVKVLPPLAAAPQLAEIANNSAAAPASVVFIRLFSRSN